jgi:hypothetical protein
MTGSGWFCRRSARWLAELRACDRR